MFAPPLLQRARRLMRAEAIASRPGRRRGLLQDPADRKAAIACALLALLFLTLGLLSPSTHNDDDLSRYFNVRAAWGSWDQVLSLWNRPAFVLLYLLPARLGYVGIEALTALVSALTCFLVYRCARSLGWRPAWLAIVLTATQPLFLTLSFSALTEPLAACLLAASLWLLLEHRDRASALLLALVPLARLELAFLLAPWAVHLARRRAWSAIAILPAGLLLWNLGGFAHTGNAAFLWLQVFAGEERLYQAVGPLHYLSGYIFVVGPVVFALSILGAIESLRRPGARLLPVSALLMLAVYTWLSSSTSAGQAAGFLRHLVTLAPLTALLALRGQERWAAPRATPLTALVLIGAALLCWRFLSVEITSSQRLGAEPEHAKLLFVALLAAVALARLLAGLRRGARRDDLGEAAAVGRRAGVPAAAASLLAITFVALRPPLLPLTAEQETMREAAGWFNAADYEDRALLCNHIWFNFYSGIDPGSERSRFVRQVEVAAAPPGAILIWDGHYSHRLGGDVTHEDIDRLGGWRLLRRFVDRDTAFYAVALEKLSADEALGRLGPDGYTHPGYGVRWDGVGREPLWSWHIQSDALRLLRGASPGAQAHLWLRRSIEVLDEEMHHAAAIAGLHRGADLSLEGIGARGPWRILWGRDGARTFFIATCVDEARCEMLWLSGECAAEERARVEEDLARWLEALRFEERDDDGS